MRPPIRWAAGLYPAPWRERYGAEFAALLDDVRPRWHDFFDILRGAILMQLKLPGSGKIVAALAAAGLVVAAVLAFRTPDRFVSTAVMRMQTASLDSLNHAQQEVLSRTTLSRIVRKEDIYQKERATDPLEDIIQNMRNQAVRVRMVTPTDHPQDAAPAFSISFEYPDRQKAQAVTNDLTTEFSKVASLTMIDPPSLPQTPTSPNRALMITVGLAIGLALGVILLGIRRWPLIAACGAAAALLGWAGSQIVPTQYVSTAVLRVPDQDAARQISESLTSRTNLASLIEKMGLYPQERKTQPLESIVEHMRNRAVRIQAIGIPQGPPAIAISYMSEDSKFTAQAVTRALVASAVESSARMALQGNTTVLDPPSLPYTPFAPNRPAWVIVGLLAGLSLGIAWTAIRHFRAPAPSHA